MLFKQNDKRSGKTLVTSKPLLISASQGYARPDEGTDWWLTSTTIWNTDEIIKRRVRDWRRLTGETGHTGERAESFRADHDSVYTSTHSVFPAPLVEWSLLRYGGKEGGRILDAFAGGPPRGLVSTIMGYEYHGWEIRKSQIDENKAVLKKLGLKGATYHHEDGRFLEGAEGQFDCALTCPPYFDLEVYSDQDDDLSNSGSYSEFNAGMWLCAQAHRPLMKPGAFVLIVISLFRDRKTKELIDFRSHTVENFREAGFEFHQEIILSKNWGSAAIRAANAWKGQKLVPRDERLLVFRTPT